jgi:hypothetical protein
MRPWSSFEQRGGWADLPAGRRVGKEEGDGARRTFQMPPDPRKGGDCLLKRPEVANRVTAV